MNRKQKWKNVQDKHDGFLLDINFDFDKLSEYGFEVNEVCALFEAKQGFIFEQILVYRDIRRPRWIDMKRVPNKRATAIIRRMYDDGILEPMKWDTYDEWRKINCNEHNILLTRGY